MKCVFFDIDRTLIDIGEDKKSCDLFEDVISALEKLKDFKLGLISNGNTEAQLDKLKATGILKYFCVLVTAERAGCAKPDRRIFEYACEQAECNVKDAAFVGDKYETDAAGGSSAGLTGVWLCRGKAEFRPAPVADITLCDIKIIKSLNELPAVLGTEG